MRRAARIDDNQKQIVKAFRGMGASVAHTHSVGKGFPDLIVGFLGINALVEVKDGNKIPSAQKLTSDQVDFHQNWKGAVYIVRDVPGVFELLKSIEDAVELREVNDGKNTIKITDATTGEFTQNAGALFEQPTNRRRTA